MAKTLITSGGANTAVSTNSTTYYYGFGNNAHQPDTAAIAEARVQHKVTTPGTLSYFALYVTANTRTTDTVVRVRINGADSGITFTVPANSTGVFSDTVHTAHVNAGDLVNFAFTTGTGSGTFTFSGTTSLAFETDNGTIVTWPSSMTSVSPAPSVAAFTGSYYAPMAGRYEGWSSNSNMFQRYKSTGTIRGIYVYVSANTLSKDVTLGVLNASGVTVVVPAGMTGLFYASSGSATISANTDYAFSLLGTGGTGSITVQRYGGEIVWDADPCLNAFSTLFNSANFGSTQTFTRIFGSLETSTTYLARACTMPFAGTINSISLNLASSATAKVVTLYKNNAATAITGNVSAAGWTTLTGAVTFNAGDTFTINYAANGDVAFRLLATSVQFDADPTPENVTDIFTGHMELTGVAFGTQFSTDISMGHLEISSSDFPPYTYTSIDTGHLIESDTGDFTSSMAQPIERGNLILNSARFLTNTSFSSEAAILALGSINPLSLASEAAILVMGDVYPIALASESAILAMGSIYPGIAASQGAVLILAEYQPCTTRRAQMWKITRRDGVVLSFTSHDKLLNWQGLDYKACNSLNASASENASDLGSVGNQELSGIIADEAISETDLYGGLYDDAYVEVWLYSWADITDTPKRLASGWMGNISQGEAGFSSEVLGQGQRIGQQALTDRITPACKVALGSAECGVDIEALKLEGSVLAMYRRNFLSCDIAGSSAGAQWENGFIRGTSGVNIGIEAEVKSVDFGSGEIQLLIDLPFVSAFGDTFDLYPGCDKAKLGGCLLYDNIINHRGFADIPGLDAILGTPDAQY